MTEEEIVKKLIHTYPNSVIYDYDSMNNIVLDYPETIDNFANNIIEDFDFNRQKYYFKVTFENKDDCAKYISSHLTSLSELCQEWLNENYNEEDY